MADMKKGVESNQFTDSPKETPSTESGAIDGESGLLPKIAVGRHVKSVGFIAEEPASAQKIPLVRDGSCLGA